MPDPVGLDPVALEAAESASLFSRPAVRPDVTAAYGEHPDQVIDFYAPHAGRPAAPLVVLLHGGAWRAPYDREHVTPFAQVLAAAGFAVANVEYRRGPAVRQCDDGAPVAGRWPDTFDDVAAAMDALPGLLAGALPQADPQRTLLAGHSAGGQLALWAAARHVLPEGSPWRLPRRPPSLRGVVALAPVADFGRAVELGVCGDAVHQLLGGPDEFEQRRKVADPAALLPTGMPTTLVQGRDDITVPCAVAEAFVAARARAGEPAALKLLDGVGHFALVDPATEACAVAVREIARLAG